jgi:hypothetical protein
LPFIAGFSFNAGHHVNDEGELERCFLFGFVGNSWLITLKKIIKIAKETMKE